MYRTFINKPYFQPIKATKMANYSIKADLLKVKGAFVKDLKGRTGAVKRCLIIPIEDSGMFLGEKGCYLNMTAIEMREARYNDTHCVKVSLPKEQYDAMTEEERNSTPILGGMHEIKASPKPIDTSAVVVDDDDLPF